MASFPPTIHARYIEWGVEGENSWGRYEAVELHFGSLRRPRKGSKGRSLRWLQLVSKVPL